MPENYAGIWWEAQASHDSGFPGAAEPTVGASHADCTRTRCTLRTAAPSKERLFDDDFKKTKGDTYERSCRSLA